VENVTGLLTSHGGKDFDAVCGALAACDYRVGAVVIDAALFVPQSRERVFIIGVSSDADVPAGLVAGGPTAPIPSVDVGRCLPGPAFRSYLVAPADPASAKFDLG
jgi:DNA (cytosine-5)-methyltransferase 1